MPIDIGKFRKRYMHDHVRVIGRKVPLVRKIYNPLAFLVRDAIFRAQDFILTNSYKEFRIDLDEPRIVKNGMKAGDERPIVLVAADDIYARKFSRRLFESFARHNEGKFLFHIHLVSNKEEEATAIARSLEEVVGDDLHITWESPDLSAATYFNRRRYLQCIRFWQAREVLYAQRRPILVLDLDLVCRGSLDFYVRNFRKAGDVGLWEQDYQYNPGKKILAGALWLNPTPSAMAFMDRVVKRIFLHLANGIFTRTLDQRSIYLARKGLRYSLTTFALPDGFISLHPHEKSILYTAAGTMPLKEGQLEEALQGSSAASPNTSPNSSPDACPSAAESVAKAR